MKHTIAVLVENKFGVLARVAGLFSARGYNIDSLAVGETEDPSVSRMTIVSDGDEKTLEQIKKQLNKLIDVIKVVDFKDGEFVDRELVLIRISAAVKTGKSASEVAKAAGCKIAGLGGKSVLVEASGDRKEINALVKILQPFGILEVVRTGRIAIGSGEIMLKADGKPEVNE
jgi:acetolactate synthase-1/3 small subunit